MLNLTKQSLSADSEVLSLNSNSVFADNKKSHPCECEDLGRIILSSRDSRIASNPRMTSLCLQSDLLSICAADAPQFSSAVYNRGTQARKLQAGAAQSGRSMIEMLGVLAIIGVLSVGGIAGYSKAMTQYKINKTADQVTQIVGSVRTLYTSQKNYNGLGSGFDTDGDVLLRKAHAIPDEMWNTDNTIEHPFGGRVIVNTGDKKSSGDGKAFGIDLHNLPEEACMALATYDWGSGSSSGLIAVAVNTVSVAHMSRDGYSVGCSGSSADSYAVACPNGSSVTIPMPVNIAANACQEGDGNWISLAFY